MRSAVALSGLLAAGLLLSGCAAASVVGSAASAVGSAVSTAVDVTGDVISGAASTVSGSSDKDDKDKKD